MSVNLNLRFVLRVGWWWWRNYRVVLVLVLVLVGTYIPIPVVRSIFKFLWLLSWVQAIFCVALKAILYIFVSLVKSEKVSAIASLGRISLLTFGFITLTPFANFVSKIFDNQALYAEYINILIRIVYSSFIILWVNRLYVVINEVLRLPSSKALVHFTYLLLFNQIQLNLNTGWKCFI